VAPQASKRHHARWSPPGSPPGGQGRPAGGPVSGFTHQRCGGRCLRVLPDGRAARPRPARPHRRRLGGPPRPPATGARGLRRARGALRGGDPPRPRDAVGPAGPAARPRPAWQPVSAAVCFHAFGRPLLGRGDSWENRMPMAEGYEKRRRAPS
jgi:hypothetical protein